ncbi:reverse transcriptase-like protein [Thalassobacillus hwangdonensis]|uniref:Reverse transcriptase-like protein n=1 Tax=Thalassobacillus hwangdonensis TaxID=546108 RepID=A0ABW3L564_9BACI
MKVRIEWTYRTPKGLKTSCFTEVMPAGKAIVLAEDMERTGRAKEVSFVDTHDSTWTLKELKAQLKEIETEPHDVKVYFDGGFDLSTRRSGLGCAIYFEQNGKSMRLRKNALVDELQTNNEAEYAALHLAIQELEAMGVHDMPVTFVGDSQVVINQMNDEWPCLEEELSRWADRIDEKLADMGVTPEFVHLSRKENREADRLASQALKGVEVESTTEAKE